MKATLILVLTFSCFCLFQIVGLAQQTRIVIQHVDVIPMDSERVLKDQTVIISEGKITGLGKNLPTQKSDQLIDGKGKYLMPGLAEMHAHVPPIDDLAPMKEVLTLFAVNGITTIRGMLGHPKHLELRDMIERGEIFGPTLYTTGPSFNGMSVTSPESGAEMVKQQNESGYDYLKLHPGLKRDEFDAIAATAKQVGIPFVGHVSYAVGVWHAIESGYSTIDHLDGFVEGLIPDMDKIPETETGPFAMFIANHADESKIPSLIAALKKANIWVVPTQSLAERWFAPGYKAESFRSDPNAHYLKSETVDQWIASKQNIIANPKYDDAKINAFVQLRRKLILECQRGGVGLLLGCDAPQVFNVPGFSTHKELEYLVGSGLTPFQALQTGTSNVAKYLGQPDTGSIKVGNTADLVLLKGNPLQDIRQTQNIDGVVLRGKWISSDQIQNELQALKKW
jgi:imidazolonepropionase-like amidohydrolase